MAPKSLCMWYAATEANFPCCREASCSFHVASPPLADVSSLGDPVWSRNSHQRLGHRRMQALPPQEGGKDKRQHSQWLKTIGRSFCERVSLLNENLYTIAAMLTLVTAWSKRSGPLQGCGAVVQRTQLRLRSSFFMTMAPAPAPFVFMSVAPAPALSFYMAPAPVLASVRFHTLIF